MSPLKPKTTTDVYNRMVADLEVIRDRETCKAEKLAAEIELKMREQAAATTEATKAVAVIDKFSELFGG
ncbi:hypothetical protein GCM10023116_01640 [Kistimonas scapharcae]|uniref:Uncharacterized protein n=1 Tax=Kistimonas scapharcae TaxID=1036133 RepID=A0ABP8UWD3_9GAMM